MDKKDEIILQQLDVIREMTERNMRRIGVDIWKNPASEPTTLVTGTHTVTAKKKENTSLTGKDPASQNAPKMAAEAGGSAPDALEKDENPKESIDDLKAELDEYIGLEAVKDEVRDLINMVTVWNLRREHGLPAPDLSLHMVFSGNPGTGKTMMARFMARVYHSLGILSKGHLVEVDRSGLVAGYVGQTAIKTASVVEKAKGGVLFIDEAYALSSGKGENDFGGEAIETILKAMEDNRDDLVVIVAGYTDLMEEFIGSNPGLESRFNRYLHFDDYTTDEMMGIFEMQCKKNCYVLEEKKDGNGEDDAKCENARVALRDAIEDEKRDEDFGNARGIRNLFERILIEQANRLAEEETVTKEMLMTITAADVDKAHEGK